MKTAAFIFATIAAFATFGDGPVVHVPKGWADVSEFAPPSGERRATATVVPPSLQSLSSRDNFVEVFANRQFSTVPFSSEDVQYLYETVSQIVLGRPDGKVRIYCDDKRHEVSRLISSFRRGEKNDLPSGDIQRVAYKLKKGKPLTKNLDEPYTI